MLNPKEITYVVSFLVFQMLVAILMFEFIRSPWKGALLQIEEAETE